MLINELESTALVGDYDLVFCASFNDVGRFGMFAFLSKNPIPENISRTARGSLKFCA